MIWISDAWKEYEVLDASNGERLERWGKYILVRPDPQVIWNTPHAAPEWKRYDARYIVDIHKQRAGQEQLEHQCFAHLDEIIIDQSGPLQPVANTDQQNNGHNGIDSRPQNMS